MTEDDIGKQVVDVAVRVNPLARFASWRESLALPSPMTHKSC
jgi:hypothetical protein